MIFGDTNVTPWFLYSGIRNHNYFLVITTLFCKFNGCIIKDLDVQYVFPLWVGINVYWYTWWINNFLLSFLSLREFLLNGLIQIYSQKGFSSKPNAPSNEYLVHISISTPSSINVLPKYWRGMSHVRTQIFLFNINSIIFWKFFLVRLTWTTRSFDLWVRWCV